MVHDLRPAHQVVGLGVSSWQPDFWISTKPDGHVSTSRENKIHLAFAAKNRQQIRDFHKLALYVVLYYLYGPRPYFCLVPLDWTILSVPYLTFFSYDCRKAGGTCNGPPGFRPQYLSTYYAAFVHDPEGRNIELHTVMPGILTEPKQWNMLVAGSFSVIALGVAYFANAGGYFSSFF